MDASIFFIDRLKIHLKCNYSYDAATDYTVHIKGYRSINKTPIYTDPELKTGIGIAGSNQVIPGKPKATS